MTRKQETKELTVQVIGRITYGLLKLLRIMVYIVMQEIKSLKQEK